MVLFLLVVQLQCSEIYAYYRLSLLDKSSSVCQGLLSD